MNVRVIPRSSEDRIEGVDETTQGPVLKIRVRAIPDRGEANRSVERVVADWLGVPRTSVGIIAGTASRTKRIGIAGRPDSVEALIKDRLADVLPAWTDRAAAHGAQR